MRCLFSSPRRGRLLLTALLMAGGMLSTLAATTGVPLELKVTPGTVRAGDKNASTVSAVVTLAAPSPTFFVCNLRSSDPGQLSFDTIVFRRGQVRGQTVGVVHWRSVRKDCAIKVGAFSIDDPNVEVWFTVNLKVADESTGDAF
jgi:hypothetical protein